MRRAGWASTEQEMLRSTLPESRKAAFVASCIPSLIQVSQEVTHMPRWLCPGLPPPQLRVAPASRRTFLQARSRATHLPD